LGDLRLVPRQPDRAEHAAVGRVRDRKLLLALHPDVEPRVGEGVGLGQAVEPARELGIPCDALDDGRSVRDLPRTKRDHSICQRPCAHLPYHRPSRFRGVLFRKERRVTTIDVRAGGGDLPLHGLNPTRTVTWSPTTSLLYEHALKAGDARIAEGGPLAVDTGKH